MEISTLLSLFTHPQLQLLEQATHLAFLGRVWKMENAGDILMGRAADVQFFFTKTLVL